MAISEKFKGIVDFLTQGIEPSDEDIFENMRGDADDDMYATTDNLALAPVSSYASKIERNNNLKVVSHPSCAGIHEVVYVQPRSFGEAGSIVQNLIDRKTVTLNLELLDKEQSQRTIDFICGAAHALNGTPQKVGEMVFVFTPSNVTMTVNTTSNENKFADVWGKSL